MTARRGREKGWPLMLIIGERESHATEKEEKGRSLMHMWRERERERLSKREKRLCSLLRKMTVSEEEKQTIATY